MENRQLERLGPAEMAAGRYVGGGAVSGMSYTGDKLIGNVNSDELIKTGTQGNNLLQEIANYPVRGMFNYEAMADAMAYAVSQQKAPVMDYQEFTDFQQKRIGRRKRE